MASQGGGFRKHTLQCYTSVVQLALLFKLTGLHIVQWQKMYHRLAGNYTSFLTVCKPFLFKEHVDRELWLCIYTHSNALTKWENQGCSHKNYGFHIWLDFDSFVSWQTERIKKIKVKLKYWIFTSWLIKPSQNIEGFLRYDTKCTKNDQIISFLITFSSILFLWLLSLHNK